MSAPLRAGALAALDLTHLRVLNTMLQEGSVRQTATRLCLSPSAVSHALARLRNVIGDELFVRTSDGMHPTARAIEIAPDLNQALFLLEEALGDRDFDPAKSKRSFCIACLPYISNLLSAAIAQKHAEAPGIQVRIRYLGPDLIEDLESGRVDYAIGAFGRVPDWIETQLLSEERMVFVMRAGGPAADRPLTMEDLAHFSHVDTQTDEQSAHLIASYHVLNGLERQVAPSGLDVLERVLEQHGFDRTVALAVCDSQSSLAAIAGTDMIGLVVERVAHRLRRMFDVELFDPPYVAPGLPIHLVWNKRLTLDSGAVWLRSVIQQVLAEQAE